VRIGYARVSTQDQNLNLQKDVLKRAGCEKIVSTAAQSLSRKFDLSRRQAYRYLAHAAKLAQPVPVEEASIPVTLKLPPRTVRVWRSYAARSGLTLGEIVTRALEAFVNALGKHG
jgi:hypothetical protein